MNCLHCNINTNNPKYCSRSCASKKTNSLFPKRKKTRKCKICNTLRSGTSHYCEEHKPSKTKPLRTIKDVIYKTHHKSSAFSLIRWMARKEFFQSNQRKCFNCRYDKHIEVCHKKPISSFNKNTLISTVNNSKNLIGLCPNCHWEYDNKILVI